ncbi:transposase [Peptococcaceae bacterium DYL19]|nr:transposase [Phosphitispora fastidiosa]MBU7005608.1 transposase [Phosphitispora fastidiosa]
MRYVEGTDRNQLIFFPDRIDDYISEDNPIRVLDQFVAVLDIKELGFTKAVPANTGRLAYNPKDLLKLYLYGYINRIRSSRKLETEAGRNLELMWLLGKLKP